MKASRDNGSVMLEFILAMPILLFLAFAVAQFSMIWIARQMAYYAAYCGARAAVVYNPEDYSAGDKFFAKSGPVYGAAFRVISFLNLKNSIDFEMRSDLWGDAQNSSRKENSGAGSNPWDDLGNLVEIYGGGFDLGSETSHRKSTEYGKERAVQVTVLFKFPLDIPMIGRVISKFDELNERSENSPGNSNSSGEYNVLGGYNFSGDGGGKSGNLREFNYIRIFATCVLPKPVDTSEYPRVSSADGALMGGVGSLPWGN